MGLSFLRVHSSVICTHFGSSGTEWAVQGSTGELQPGALGAGRGAWLAAGLPQHSVGVGWQLLQALLDTAGPPAWPWCPAQLQGSAAVVGGPAGHICVGTTAACWDQPKGSLSP